MLLRLLLFAIGLTSLFLSGCATPTKMAFSDPSESIIKEDKAVYLMTATIKNSYKSSHQPKLLVVHVEKGAGNNSADRLNFKADDISKMESDTLEGSTYLLRMELDIGVYTIRGLSSMSRSFPIYGFFFTPIHANLTVANHGVYYLGHVEANVRERQGDEFKAGPTLPLLDQALAGSSTGTFDVKISDEWITDEAKFKDKFHVLSNIMITKNILPQFDREKAQKWWEEN